jgi:hypothetical protein
VKLKFPSFNELKDFFYIRGQAEREFKVEVEAIGRVRHKNLVRLLGFCVEGATRYFSNNYIQQD